MPENLDQNKALVMELARSEHVELRENIIAVGNSGTGKMRIPVKADSVYVSRRTALR